MVGLHACDDAEGAEARNVGGRDVLRVLDAEAGVLKVLLARDALEDVELGADGAIADGMDGNVKPGGRGA